MLKQDYTKVESARFPAALISKNTNPKEYKSDLKGS